MPPRSRRGAAFASAHEGQSQLGGEDLNRPHRNLHANAANKSGQRDAERRRRANWRRGAQNRCRRAACAARCPAAAANAAPAASAAGAASAGAAACSAATPSAFAREAAGARAGAAHGEARDVQPLATCSREPSANASSARGVCSVVGIYLAHLRRREGKSGDGSRKWRVWPVGGWRRRTMRGGASVDVLAIARYEANGPSMCGVRHDRYARARHNARSRTNDRTLVKLKVRTLSHRVGHHALVASASLLALSSP